MLVNPLTSLSGTMNILKMVALFPNGGGEWGWGDVH